VYRTIVHPNKLSAVMEIRLISTWFLKVLGKNRLVHPAFPAGMLTNPKNIILLSMDGVIAIFTNKGLYDGSTALGNANDHSYSIFL